MSLSYPADEGSFAAYDWQSDLRDVEILEKLLALIWRGQNLNVIASPLSGEAISSPQSAHRLRGDCFGLRPRSDMA